MWGVWCVGAVRGVVHGVDRREDGVGCPVLCLV